MLEGGHSGKWNPFRCEYSSLIGHLTLNFLSHFCCGGWDLIFLTNNLWHTFLTKYFPNLPKAIMSTWNFSLFIHTFHQNIEPSFSSGLTHSSWQLAASISGRFSRDFTPGKLQSCSFLTHLSASYRFTSDHLRLINVFLININISSSEIVGVSLHWKCETKRAAGDFNCPNSSLPRGGIILETFQSFIQSGGRVPCFGQGLEGSTC